MAKYLLIEEIHIRISVPQGLSVRSVDAIRLRLSSARFDGALRRLLRRFVRRYPPLRQVQVRVRVTR